MASIGSDQFSLSHHPSPLEGQVSMTRTPTQVNIKISGEFTFKMRQEFRAAYINESPDLQYIVDMAQVVVMDSSAMGMLLVLREHAGGEKAKISLINLSSKMNNLLRLASLHEIFHLG